MSQHSMGYSERRDTMDRLAAGAWISQKKNVQNKIRLRKIIKELTVDSGHTDLKIQMYPLVTYEQWAPAGCHICVTLRMIDAPNGCVAPRGRQLEPRIRKIVMTFGVIYNKTVN